MKHQAFRPAALMLSVLVLSVASAKADTVHFVESVHRVPYERVRGAVDVRLGVASQNNNVSSAVQQSGQAGSASTPQQSSPSVAQTSQQTRSPGSSTTDGTTPVSTNGTTDSTLSQSGGQIETVDLGDVTGTVCDCGEIPVPPAAAGGFPRWPFLAGVPLICLSGVCAGDDDRPPPRCCDEEQPPIPEPATLLLFGTGLLALGAGARRRYSRRRSIVAAGSAEEVI